MKRWPERQLQAKGIAYVKDGNCFPWIEDTDAAQELLDQQLQTNWSEVLNTLTFRMCPDLQDALSIPPDYYWSADTTEWATDIMFHSRQELEVIYPDLIYHAMKTSDSSAVMRFFGRCEISQQCNDRYADALASVQIEETLKEVISPACNRIKKRGKRYRGLNPWQAEDFRLLTFLAKGEQPDESSC